MTPRDAPSPKAIRGRTASGAVLSCSPRKQSFFSSFENRRNIYIYIFIFSRGVAPELVCTATACGLPHLPLRGEAWPRGLVLAGGPGARPGWAGRVFPSRRRQTRGVGTGLAQSRSSGLGASAGRPSPRPETSPPSLWGQKPQGRGHWGLPGRKGHRACPLQSASGPWHRSAVTEPAPCPLARRGETWLQAGLLGPHLANYCDVTPVPRSPRLDGSSKATPFLRPQLGARACPFKLSPHLRIILIIWGPNRVH